MKPLPFYAEVRLARPAPHNAALRDAVGVIVGRTDEPTQPPGYGVALHGQDEIACCDHDELEPTGRQFRREDFYDDTKAIRVRVDDQGRGHLA